MFIRMPFLQRDEEKQEKQMPLDILLTDDDACVIFHYYLYATSENNQF